MSVVERMGERLARQIDRRAFLRRTSALSSRLRVVVQ